MKQFIGSGRFVWFLVLCVMGIAVYGAGFGIRYYSDDFQFLYHTVSTSYLHWLQHPNPYVVYAYRPIEAWILLAIQTNFGLNTVPVHLVALAAHVLLSWLIYPFMLRKGFTPAQALLGSGFMLVSQANAHAVMSNDTLSQVFGTLFGCASLWFLYRSLNASEKPPTIAAWGYLLSLSFFLLALLSKETSFGFLPMALGLILVHYLKSDKQKPLWQPALKATPFLLIGIAYMGLRSYVGVQRPNFGSGDEVGFQIGINILYNLLLFIFAAVVPASNPLAYVALHSRDLLLLVLIVAGSLVFMGAVLYGLARSTRREAIFSFTALAVLGLFPAILMTHVSELYLYNSMPFISILVGIGLGHIVEQRMKERKGYGIALAAICLLFISHIAAIQHKAALMKHNGERANLLMNQLQTLATNTPENGTLILLNPQSERPRYSVYLLDGFDVLEFASSRVRYLSNRPDIKVRIVDQGEMDEELTSGIESGKAYILTLEGNQIIPLK